MPESPQAVISKRGAALECLGSAARGAALRGIDTRTNIEIDDELIARPMRVYGLKTKREAVDFALQRQASLQLA